LDNKYSDFENLIKKISIEFGLSDGEISKAVGRNEGYISQLRSRHKKDGSLPPDKFVETLKLRFAKPTQNEEIASLRAAVKILTLKAIEHESKLTGVSFAQASLEIEKMMQSEGSRLASAGG